MRLTVVPVLLLAALSGCTYVTKSDWDAKVDCLDEDQDGAVRSARCTEPGVLIDCDDANADRAPNLAEIPYDGIDNDCDPFGADIVDVDGDGYPFVLEADWVSNDGVTTYPTGLQTQADCNDDAPTIFPGSGSETPYDGIDHNCDGTNDWDADGDGFTIRPDLLPAGAAPIEGDLPGGDCDDTANSINPGFTLTDDTLYDGVDTNCDGLNDFDADNDGWMVDRPNTETEFTTFVERFGYEGNFALYFGDCNDDDNTINPDAPDAFYDAIDSNCDNADDYDQDVDGFVLSAELRPSGSPPYPGSLPTGDCVDTSDIVYPGALERLGDTTDTDCDGGDNTTPLHFHTLHSFEAPRPPVVGAIDGMYLMFVATNAFRPELNIVQADAGVFYRFPYTAQTSGPPLPPSPDSQPVGHEFFELNGGGVISDQFDVEFREDYFVVAKSHFRDENTVPKNQIRIERFLLQPNGAFARSAQRNIFGPNNTQYTGFDLEEAPGGFWTALGCADSVIQMKLVSELTTNLSLLDDTNLVLSGNTTPTHAGASCFLEHNSSSATRQNPIVHTFGPGQEDFELDASGTLIAIGSDPTLSGFTVNSVVQRSGFAALTGSSPGLSVPRGLTLIEDGVVLGAYLNSEEVYWASAMRSGASMYAAAVVRDRNTDGFDEVVVLFGNPVNPTEVELVLETESGEPIDPTGVSIWADDDRIFLSVTGNVTGGEVIGWSFLQPPA